MKPEPERSFDPAPMARVDILADRLQTALTRRRRRSYLFLLVAPALALAAGVLGVLLQPRVYQADGLIRLVPSALYRPPLTSAPAPVSVRRLLQNELQWLTSDSFLRRVQSRLPVRPVVSSFARREGADLNVAVLPGTEVLHLSARSADPVLAADVVNAAVDEAPRNRFERESEHARSLRGYLLERLESVRRAIVADRARQRAAGRTGLETELVLRRFERSSPLPGAGRFAMEADLESFGIAVDPFDFEMNLLDAALTRERLNELLAEARLRLAERAQASGRDPADASIGSAVAVTLGRLRAKLNEDQTTYASLGAQLGSNAPQMQALASSLAEMRRELAEEHGRNRAALRSAVALAHLRRAALAQALDARGRRLAAAQRSTVLSTLLDLELVLDLNVQANLRGRLGALRVDLAGGPLDVETIDRADAPLVLQRREYRRYVLPPMEMAGAVTFIVVVGLVVFIRARWSVAELERRLDLPVGAVLAERSVPAGTRASYPRRGTEPDAYEPLPLELAELAGMLELAAGTHAPGYVVLVTSATPAEGKTTTVTGLASRLARGGRRVLLVDCDLHRPTLHHRLGLSGRVGLSTVLGRAATLPQAVQAPAHVPGLAVLAAGPLPPTPANQLRSAEMQTLLEEARGLYDFILLDTPPLLATSDALELGAHIDEALLVVRFGKVSLAIPERALKLCVHVGLPVSWMVVNGVPEAMLRDPAGRVQAAAWIHK